MTDQETTGEDEDIDFVETEQEEDIDDGILQSDWAADGKEKEEEVQNIPLDHDLHGEVSDTVFVAFGQQFSSGKVITAKELYSMKDRATSSGQKLEKIPMWLDICPPTDDSAKVLEQVFNLHPLTIDDWFTPDSREKAAFFEDYFAISVVEMRYIDDTNILKTYLLNIVVKKNVILTIHTEPILSVSEVRVRIRDKYQGTFPSAHWVLYAILELIISKFNVLNERLYSDVFSIEQLSLVLLHDDQDEFLSRIGDLKKRTNLLQFLVSPKKSFLRFILKSKSHMVSKNLKIYLRDILDDTVRLLEKLSSLTHNIENHQETYLAKISLSVNRYSEEENQLMKKFGAIATLFLPMTFIAALFGMNVTVPGQNDPSLVWFSLIIGICIIWTIVGIVLFKIYNWF
ncbi:Magnesium transport protein corA, putative [Entamoeba invadens IP1]|uniref:Magnesium transport protein corA, putative n=1 Tax=Entamoeba invadens IP1 TaxID=370355 RepID=UPI0002C3E0FF|nr:Magnesium transport protein corA, putative [Entamoeba invadens IP1]ELP90408.1 Magnesium transport protein corA, putative [Entamoeba invadens IP1]|eukprot:XP_004257179.1 Magnesium transport protein corA, putative [Entamoeba invadens IP1]